MMGLMDLAGGQGFQMNSRSTAIGRAWQNMRCGRPETHSPCVVNPRIIGLHRPSKNKATCHENGIEMGHTDERRSMSGSRRLAVGAAVLAAFTAGTADAHAKTTLIKEEVTGERVIKTTASGVKFTDVSIGEGPAVRTGSAVVMHVVGTLEDGSEFLNTYATGVPVSFSLGVRPGNVTEGLEEGLQGMNAGGRRLIAVPPSMGYSQRGARAANGTSIPGNSPLFYDVEVLRCLTAPSRAGLACCSERSYPCQPPEEQQ